MKKLYFIFSFLFLSQAAFSQASNNPGLASKGSLFPQNHQNLDKNSIGFNLEYGIGVDNTHIIQPSLNASIVLSKKNFLQLRLPYYFASGNIDKIEINTGGIGDIIASINHILYKNKQVSLLFGIGFKIPTNDADKSIKNPNGKDLPLPMVYQTSLATFDLLSGFSLSYKNWYFEFAYQQPLYQQNDNQYLKSIWDPFNAGVTSEDYGNSKELKVKADIMFRVERKFDLNEKSALNLGIVPIFHLGKDSYSNEVDERFKIKQTNGLTFNLTLDWKYRLNQNLDFTLRAGLPIESKKELKVLGLRKNSPNGLRRAFVITPTITYRL